MTRYLYDFIIRFLFSNLEKPLYQALFTPYSFTLDINTTVSTCFIFRKASTPRANPPYSEAWHKPASRTSGRQETIQQPGFCQRRKIFDHGGCRQILRLEASDKKIHRQRKTL